MTTTIATIATDNPFNPREQRLLRALCGLIIPASTDYNVPGADDDLIYADIVRSAGATADDVRRGLEVAAATLPSNEEPPNEVPPNETTPDEKPPDEEPLDQQALDEAAAQLEGHPDMAALVTLVMQCYYRDDRVMRSIGMEPRPPFPLGYSLEQGDWSMLEPVQRRGRIWRDTSDTSDK